MRTLAWILAALLAIPALALANDSLNVRRVGSWPYYASHAIAVDTIGGHTYAVTGFGSGIFIFNVDSSTAPVKISELAVNGWQIYDLVISGSHAYFTAENTGLWIVDISNPYVPMIAGQCMVPGFASGLAIAGNYAYVATSTEGMRIIDISNPSNPVPLGYYIASGFNSYIEHVEVRDTLAFVSASDQGLRIVNVKDPSNPVEIGHYDSTGIRDVALAGRYAYLARSNSDSIIVMDISDPTHPIKAGAGGKVANFIVLYDTLAFGGTQAYDHIFVNSISDSVHPRLLCDYYDGVGGAWQACNFAFTPGYAYVAADMGGLQIYDISNPANIIKVGQYKTPQVSGQGAVVNGMAYMPTDVLHVIDVSNPFAPKQRGYWSSDSAYVEDVVIKDTIALATDYKFGLRIFNVADPANPVLVDSLKLIGYQYGIDIKDTIAYIAADTMGLYIVNVADLFNPFVAGRFNTPRHARDVKVAGNIAYVADGGQGLRLINISKPDSSFEIGSYNTPGNSQGVTVQDSFAYVADGSSGMRIVNVANPQSPFETGFYDMGINYVLGAYSIAIVGKLAYIGYDTLGLRVVNVADPVNPAEVGHYKMDYYPSLYVFHHGASGVSVYNGNAFVSYDVHGLQVFQYYGPTGIEGIANDELRISNALSCNQPNPFTTNTAIRYQLSAISNVTLIVYNVMGQQIKTLASGRQQAGAHQVAWNGRDDEGRQLAAGVYFCRLSINDQPLTVKMIKVK